MARQYAPVKVAIWADDDFRNLSVLAQHLYFLLLTSPTLSHAGVADWRPRRIAALARGWNVEMVEQAGEELEQARYVVVDRDTEEILIRSFVRHDGLMKQPKMAVSMAEAHAAVASSLIRGVIVHELRRLQQEQPELSGWAVAKAADLLSKNAADPYTDPSPDNNPLPPHDPNKGLLWGSETPNGTPKQTPNRSGSGKGSGFPAPITNSCNYNQQPGSVAVAVPEAETPPPLTPQQSAELGRRAATITAAWVKIRRTRGQAPSQRQVGTVGANILEALRGNPFELVMAATQNAALGGYVNVDVEISKLTAEPKKTRAQAARDQLDNEWDQIAATIDGQSVLPRQIGAGQ